MPAQQKNGRTHKHRSGYIALGYSIADDFWYSSEGVFGKAEDAKNDIDRLYEVDYSYAVKVELKSHEKAGK